MTIHFDPLGNERGPDESGPLSDPCLPGYSYSIVAGGLEVMS